MMNHKLIQEIFFVALEGGGDFCEVFLEDNFTTEIATLGGVIESGMSGRDFGLGIRIFKDLQTAYGFTNDLSKESLLGLTKKLTASLQGRKEGREVNVDRRIKPIHHPVKQYPSTVEFSKKVELTKRAYHAGMDYDPLIRQMRVHYLDQEQDVLIANTEGVFVEDKRVKTRMLLVAVAEHEGKMETGYMGPGAMMGMEFYDTFQIEDYAREAARSAKTMVLADPCPSGKMPVVVDHGFGGLMFHEACGHSLEASSVAKGLSVFSNRLGEKVASDVVTLIDDGSIESAWGSLGVDDEGMPTQKNILIEKGVLKGYMIDRLGGKRMGMHPTASGRRQSYRFPPTSRMSNTYIDAGESTKEEIIAKTEKGLFAKYLSAGSVNPATGDFNFSLSEAYLIEDGKITKPVKGATLIGNGNTVLQDVDMVADNLEIGQGYCFAASGAIFIGAGQPTLRIKSMTVGGRE